MKISTKGRYGIRVMMELANHYGCGPIPVEAIAKNQEISSKYIHILVGGLRSAGLLRTVRGPSGGFELAKSPSVTTLLEVVSALEGNTAPVECVIDPSVCSRSSQCAARDVWCSVAAAIEGALSSLTLEQLVANHRRKVEEQLDYCI